MPSTTTHKKQKVAILGGGLSSLVTAFELTQQPNWHKHYDITIYQMGWRLGGKGASGRNQEQHNRIEEHGLHIFFGFYDNAFTVLQKCYAELDQTPLNPYLRFDEYFKGHNLISYWDFHEKRFYDITFPPNELKPGESPTVQPKTLEEYTEGLFLFLFKWLHELAEQPPLSQPHLPLEGPLTDALQALLKMLPPTGKGLAEGPLNLLRHLMGVGGMLLEVVKDLLPESWVEIETIAAQDLVRLIAHALSVNLPLLKTITEDSLKVFKQLKSVFQMIDELLPRKEGAKVEFWAYTTYVLTDLFHAVCNGLLQANCIAGYVDWFAPEFDKHSFRKWLVQYGAEEQTIDSFPIFGVLDAFFSRQQDGAAGAVLHGLFEIFNYKGSVMWKMQAGMGDTIFAPLYAALKKRGVKFEFFHRVDSLHLASEKKDGARPIEKITLYRQATLKKSLPYEPLITVPFQREVDGQFQEHDLPCWPSEPLYDQLEEGAILKEQGINLEDWWTEWKEPEKVELHQGADFDLVVLGASIGILPDICQELLNDPENTPFANMLQQVKTVQTQAMQLWFKPDLKGLGWPAAPPVSDGYYEPFDTWADMSHLLPKESWPDNMVHNLAYHCSPLPDDAEGPLPSRTEHGYAQQQQARVKKHALAFLKQSVKGLWPKAIHKESGELNCDLLVDPENREGMDRFEAQYWNAPTNPSDRYVLSVPGSTRARLKANGSGYSNLYLTGDWTWNPISLGCAEAATIAGKYTCQAMVGASATTQVYNDWLQETDQAILSKQVPLIVRDGALYYHQPYEGKQFLSHAFLLPANQDKLNLICEQHLNLGHLKYEPLIPYVLFVATETHRMQQIGDPDYMKEMDFGFWIPVVKTPHNSSIDHFDVADVIQFYQPYLWVNSDIASRNGREIFGFNKSAADLVYPESPASEQLFSCHTYVLDEGQTKVGLAELLSIQKMASAPPLTWLEEGTTLLSRVWQHPQLGMVFLKQFPDIHNGLTACYQAVTEVHTQFSKVAVPQFDEAHFHFLIRRCKSHHIVEALGLHCQPDSPREGFDAVRCIRVSIDEDTNFDVGNGRVVYRSI